jgi:hypothetical protein
MKLKKYILETLGIAIQPLSLKENQLTVLPLYVRETYKLYDLSMFNRLLLLAEIVQENDFSILQTEKQFVLLRNLFGKNVVLLSNDISAINRKRLIAKGINFIVPGKQMYLPDLLIDLNEKFSSQRNKSKIESLLPSAQFLIIYHMNHRNDVWRIEENSFKEIAKKTGYTAMAITKAVENLKTYALIDVVGEKEKFIHFRMGISEMWNYLLERKLLINPVFKRVYVDEILKTIMLLNSNVSALAEYSDINAGQQPYYAIEKSIFYELKKANKLVNINEVEGQICIEVWKYNPYILIGDLSPIKSVVDPLSLFLSLRENSDERIDMALDQIVKKYIW